MAKVTKAFTAVRPGRVYPEQIEVGEDVDGDLEKVAAELGALEVAATVTSAPSVSDDPKPSDPSKPAKPSGNKAEGKVA